MNEALSTIWDFPYPDLNMTYIGDLPVAEKEIIDDKMEEIDVATAIRYF